MSARQRLSIPIFLFTIVLGAVIALLVVTSDTTAQEKLRIEAAQRAESVRATLANSVAQTRAFSMLVAANPAVQRAATEGNEARIRTTLRPFRRRVDLELLALYRLDGTPITGTSGRTDPTLLAMIRSVAAGAAGIAGIATVDRRLGFVSAARFADAPFVVVSGDAIDDRYVTEIAHATGSDIALYFHGHVVASSVELDRSHRIPARFQQTAVTPERDLVNGGRLALVVLQDPSEDLAKAHQALMLVIAAIGVAGLFSLGMSLHAIRSVTRSEERLRHEATHDALTGLANRRYFSICLQDAVDAYRLSPERQYAILYIDLDHFKFVNDSLGHEVGDRVLVAIGDRVKRSTRGGDVVARLGGDEFAVLLSHLRDSDDASRVLERVQTELSAPVSVDGRTIFTTASIGITFGAPTYVRGEDLLRDADAALYRAKTLGRARHVVFNSEMLTTARMRFQIDTELRLAMDRNELRLNYQPIHDMRNGRLSGFEALLRWRHPRLGDISPLDFIPVAEETGLILGIGGWVIDEACRQLATWRRENPPLADVTMSINLSARQIVQPNIVEQIAATLRTHGLRGSDLKLEITESVIIDGSRLDPNVIDEIKSLGVGLWIDDFGTGYSSLTYLQRYPVDGFKIDHSFVRGNGADLHSPQIVATLLRLGQSLDLVVVAEGIETEEQRTALVELGCDYGQGFGLHRPLEAADAGALLHSIYGTATA